MDLTKQQLLLNYLISSNELYIKVSPILKSSYFDARLRGAVNFIKEYFEEYKSAPTPEQITVETKQAVMLKPMQRAEIAYAEHEIEAFCKNSAMEAAIMAGPALLQAGKPAEIEKMFRDALTISLNRSIGLDYFNDPEARLKLLSLSSNNVSTGWIKLDEYLGGGLNRKEMCIFAAGPGVGKSLTMANLARNLMKRGLNGVYFTLELAEEVVAKRFDSMFSGIAQSEILKNITETSIKIKAAGGEGIGKLFIKRVPESSTNANHLRAYLKEFEIVNGFVPDFIVVDYLDLMASVQQVSAENTFARDKFISEELRAIANEYNLIMITASQLNRGSMQVENIEDVGQAHMAGGISKVNTTDNLIAILQTPQMKSRGEMMFKMLKTRSSNGVGNHFMMRFSSSSLVLTDLDGLDGQTSTMAGALSGFAARRAAALSASANIESPPKTGVDLDDLPFQV